MTAENPSDVVSENPTELYLWVTTDEAAEALDASNETILLRAREGDLESRVNERGQIEVLLRLPKDWTTLTESYAIPSIQERRMPGGPTLLPMSSSTRWRAFQKTNAPRRAARVAWSAAAAMSLVAATASLIAQSIATGARERSAVLARRLEMVSLAVNDLSTQRDRLRGQLADTTDELSKVQGELTIDRNVEDTLFKAIQTAQAHKPVDSKSPQFADVGR